jgi:hypothetical protein
MEKIKRLAVFIIGCILSAGIGLGCWGTLNLMPMVSHPYLIVVIVNMIGYMGHGVTAYIARKYIK